MRGGGRSELQTQSLLAVLPLLVDSRGINEKTCADLLAAYRFLRRLENAIQMIADKQTHELPSDENNRARVVLTLRLKDWDELIEILDQHRACVSEHFGRIAFRGQDVDSVHSHQQSLSELWEQRANELRWSEALEDAGFDKAAGIARCAFLAFVK